MKIAKRSEKAESKNRPVATNFQFLKILAPFGTASCWGVPAPNPARNEYSKLELVGARPLHLAAARPFCHLKAPLGLSLFRFAPQTRSCKFFYYHIFKTCFAFALTNWIIGPEMITVISVHTPNFPPNKTPVTTTKISNAIRTNLICQ